MHTTAHTNAIGRRFLVVDDQLFIRKATTLMLRKAGAADVIAASNGPDAIIMAQNQRFDVVILDINLKGINGFETSRRIRAHQGDDSALIILGISGDSAHQMQAQAKASGMDAFLEKPVRLAQLMEVIGPPAKTANCSDADEYLIFHMDNVLQRFAGDQKIARRITQAFVDEFPASRQQLSSALETHNHAEAARIAHALKGSAGYVGAFALQQAASALEKAGRQGRYHHLDGLADELSRCLDEFEQVFLATKWD